MQFTGFLFDSLKIDALKTKWVVRILFLILIFMFVFPRVYTVGNSDFSFISEFFDQYSLEYMANVDQVQFPAITMSHLVYLAFNLVFDVLRFLVLLFYAGLFVYDARDLKPGRILWMSFKKVPAVIFMLMLIVIPFIIVYTLIPPLLLFVLPAFFIAPTIIFDRKRFALDALLESARLTKGFKLSIFFNVIVLLSFQWVGLLVASFIINYDSVGYILVGAFFSAYLYLAIGRNMGTMYRLITATTQS